MKNLLQYKKFILLSCSILVIWLIFFIFALMSKSVSEYEANIIAKIEFIIQVFTIYLFFKEYKKVDESKLYYLYLLIINIWLLVVDIFFYIATYFTDSYLQNLSYLQFIFYYIPCILYAIISIIFFVKLIFNNIIKDKNYHYRLSILILISLLIFSLYLSSIKSAYDVYSFKNVLQIILLFTEFILFDICLLGIIYANNISVMLLLISFIAFVSGDFFLTYQYISQTITNSLIIGEYLWGLGLIFLLLVILSMKVSKNYNIRLWFRNDSAIKSRVAFYVYLISITSYLIIYGLSYFLGIIGYKFFIIFPILTILYSIIVVCLSIIIGKAFEEPFTLLIKNISLYNKNDKLPFLNDPTIEEFKYLQNFIIKVIDINKDNFKIQSQFCEVAVNGAHALKSPLLTINAIISEGNKSNFNDKSLLILNSALNKIKNITTELVDSYRQLTHKTSLTDLNLKIFEIINIEELIEDLLINKQIEWRDNLCIISVEKQLTYPVWGFKSSYIDTYNMFSNLLNNAYDSLGVDNRNIVIKIQLTQEYLSMSIKDMGCGISENRLAEILQNERSFKHNGNGIGISSAIKFAKFNNGKFEIKSTECAGTEVIIIFYPI